ncbi:hypothetical protein [Candidatus Palauibacter sp.]|uniref:hypothetical protein n=1 Tax=Candidatus Palauibacter sp. TaxID=3101350 RepID=UPI003AF227E4
MALSTPGSALGQTEQEASTREMTIQDVRAPQSPAFVLLGASPTSVERPMTPKAFAISLASARGGDTDLIPNNYALEVAPYWLREHPQLTFDDYYDAGFLQRIAQTLSISLASQRLTDAGKIADSELEGGGTVTTMSGSRVSLGARTMLVSGRAHPSLKQKRDSLNVLQGKLLDLIEQEEDEKITKEQYDERSASVRQAMQSTALEVQELDHNRVGWQIELAGASLWSFPGDTFEGGRVSKWGAWLTASYRCACRETPFESGAELIAVFRYIDDRPLPPTGSARATAILTPEEDALDVGVRGVWHLDDKMSLSFETVRRSVRDSDGVMEMIEAADSSNRTVGIIEYQITEGSYLYASFGKDFAKAGRPAGVTSVFGINIGLGDKPVVRFTEP